MAEPKPGPTLRTVQMHLATPAAPATAIVVRNEKCTKSPKSAGIVRHIALDISATPFAGKFAAGQSFGVLPPGMDANAKPHKLRLYSIASPTWGEDGKGNVLATTVKRTIDEHHDTGKLFLGVCSNYLCDLREGDHVQVTGPNGKRFVLPENPADHDYLFVATGTGIAPFRGMAMELLRTAPKSLITLVMGAPYATDLLYDAQFRDLQSAHPTFRYLTALSRERQEDGTPPMYVDARLLHAQERVYETLASPRGLVYICGIAGMELGVLRRVFECAGEGSREHYVALGPNAPTDPAQWKREMIHKGVNPSRRVFMEVYD